jgi:hypothetical protein
MLCTSTHLGPKLSLATAFAWREKNLAAPLAERNSLQLCLSMFGERATANPR